MSTDFANDKILGGALLGWWRSLRDDPGGRAQLKRAHDITSVVLTPAFQRARHRLIAAGWKARAAGSFYEDGLAAAVGLVAHVKDHAEGISMPRAMGERVSELRFMRLLDAPDAQAVFVGARRLMPLIDSASGNGLDVRTLARDIVNWGDQTKKRWSYEYAWPQRAAS